MSTIAHLANFYGPRSGGLRTTVNALSREYEHLGHTAHIIVPAERHRTTTRGAVTTHEIASPRIPGSGGYRLIWRLPRVRELLAHIKPDALELSDRTTLVPLGDWARKRDIPTTLDSPIDATYGPQGVLTPLCAQPDLPARSLIGWALTTALCHLEWT